MQVPVLGCTFLTLSDREESTAENRQLSERGSAPIIRALMISALMIGAQKCHLPVPPTCAHQCHPPVPTHQWCPPVPPTSAAQQCCQSVPPVSAQGLCQSVPPVSAQK
ncbi:unnamed protein product [Staurois parvus]|uniref:Uncharacterized protein n=1 Tax=Staurois parvus TaxID=386267 RepID=A0ABN9G1P2_9NEOB|nr:unnamed protein product [Staurois parvus]